jgi:hypothetical protein
MIAPSRNPSLETILPATKPQPELVRRIYQKAVSDEAAVVQGWSNASEDKKQAVTELGFPPSSEELLRNSANPLLEKQIKSVAAAHRSTIKKHLPSLTTYRPSELVIASLQAAWEPYAELLLRAAKSMAGADFGKIKLELINSGFEQTILDFFRENQERKYFLQQTPKSIARLIVTRRHPKRIGSEESLRTAEKHIYGRNRRKKSNPPA